MRKRRKTFRSPLKQKILLLVEAGLALGLKQQTIGRQLYIIKSVAKEWKNIERRYLYRVLNEFRLDRLVEYREFADGTIKVVLTEKGKEWTLQFNLDMLEIKKPARWDGRWRLVIFDIPEKKRAARDALRDKLRDLGFYEWQKSVFIHPYACRDEIDFVVEVFESRPYVRYAELINPTNEAELKLHFGL